MCVLCINYRYHIRARNLKTSISRPKTREINLTKLWLFEIKSNSILKRQLFNNVVSQKWKKAIANLEMSIANWLTEIALFSYFSPIVVFPNISIKKNKIKHVPKKIYIVDLTDRPSKSDLWWERWKWCLYWLHGL